MNEIYKKPSYDHVLTDSESIFMILRVDNGSIRSRSSGFARSIRIQRITLSVVRVGSHASSDGISRVPLNRKIGTLSTNDNGLVSRRRALRDHVVAQARVLIDANFDRGNDPFVDKNRGDKKRSNTHQQSSSFCQCSAQRDTLYQRYRRHPTASSSANFATQFSITHKTMSMIGSNDNQSIIVFPDLLKVCTAVISSFLVDEAAQKHTFN